MSIQIRFAKAGDETAIAALLEQIFAQHANGRPDLFGSGRSKYTAEDVLKLFNNPQEPIFVAADDNDRVLGYAFCMIKEFTSPAKYKTLYLDDLNVDTSARRQGIATALVDACRKYGKENDCYNLTLNVWAFNEGAIRFYEKNGFHSQRFILEDIL